MRFINIILLLFAAAFLGGAQALCDTPATQNVRIAENSDVKNAGADSCVACSNNSSSHDIVPCFWERNQTVISIICAFLTCVAVGITFHFETSRRMLRRSMVLYASIPARIGACARDGSILFLRDDTIHDPDSIERLSQLPNIDTKAIRQMFNTVFNTRSQQTFDYEYKNAKRSMTVAPLASEIFGKDAVIWISHDNSELQDARNEAKVFAEQSRHNLVKFKRATHLIDILINGLPCHIFAKNPDDGFKYVFINDSVTKFLGIKKEDAIGNDDFGIFQHDIAKIVREKDIMMLSENRGTITYTLKIFSNEGKSIDMRVTTFPFVDDDGSKLIIGAAFDISEMLAQNETDQPVQS